VSVFTCARPRTSTCLTHVGTEGEPTPE
jgi:hypothetical protein